MKNSNDYKNSKTNNNINRYTSFRMKKRDSNDTILIQNINNDKQLKSDDSTLKSDINNNIIANNIFGVKENINNQIINYNKDENNEKKNGYITINDIIGGKCNLNIDILRYFYFNYEPSKTSKKKMGIIKSYAVNTYQGIIRNYNEDRVSIMVNMNKPRGYYKKYWPRVSFFGIYDGHGGETCPEFLRDNLHDYIIHNNEYFPENIPEAIKLAFNKAEKNFIENYALDKKKELKDKSGSCAVVILIVDNKIYIANVGDSRCLLSMENGKKYIEVTKDHKPNLPEEMERIVKYGGKVYRTETLIRKVSNAKLIGKKIIGPFRVSPGGLSVSRTIGDVEAKLEKYGGNSNVVISTPDIFIYDLNKDDIDFFILGCDGIFDQLSSDEVINCAWMIYNNKDNILVSQCKDIHKQSGLITDLIMKSALARKSLDNVTCLFISFKEIWNNGLSDNIINDNDERTISSSDFTYNDENNNTKNIRKSYTSSLSTRINLNNNKIKNKENYNFNINNNNKIMNPNDKNKTQYNNIKNSNENDNKIELKNDNNKNSNINDNSSNNKNKINTNNEKISIRKSYLLNKRNNKSNEIKTDEAINTKQSIKSNNINDNYSNKQYDNNINSNSKSVNTLTRRSYYSSNNNYK